MIVTHLHGRWRWSTLLLLNPIEILLNVGLGHFPDLNIDKETRLVDNDDRVGQLTMPDLMIRVACSIS